MLSEDFKYDITETQVLKSVIEYYMKNGDGLLCFHFPNNQIMVDCNEEEYDVDDFLFVVKSSDKDGSVVHNIIVLSKVSYFQYCERD